MQENNDEKHEHPISWSCKILSTLGQWFWAVLSVGRADYGLYPVLTRRRSLLTTPVLMSPRGLIEYAYRQQPQRGSRQGAANAIVSFMFRSTSDASEQNQESNCGPGPSVRDFVHREPSHGGCGRHWQLGGRPRRLRTRSRRPRERRSSGTSASPHWT